MDAGADLAAEADATGAAFAAAFLAGGPETFTVAVGVCFGGRLIRTVCFFCP